MGLLRPLWEEGTASAVCGGLEAGVEKGREWGHGGGDHGESGVSLGWNFLNICRPNDCGALKPLDAWASSRGSWVLPMWCRLLAVLRKYLPLGSIACFRS